MQLLSIYSSSQVISERSAISFGREIDAVRKRDAYPLQERNLERGRSGVSTSRFPPNWFVHTCLWWDGNAPVIIYNGNNLVLLALATFQSLNVEDDFLFWLKGAYSSCNYFSNENIGRRKRQLIEKSTDGLFRYHNRVVIPRLALALIKALLV
jgi:hypothetical protein